MRTKVISRFCKAVVTATAAASLVVPPAALAQQEQPAPPPAGEVGGTQAAPPAQQPDAGEGQTYTIQKGDTLWDLSQKFLNNPWYWPKIWSLNPGIENPHWIYPGNKLKVMPGAGGAPAQVEAQAAASPADGQPAAPGDQPAGETNAAADDQLAVAPSAEGADFAVAGKDQGELAASQRSVSAAGRLSFTPPPVLRVRQSGLVTPEEKEAAGRIDSSFEEKQMLAQFDTAYVEFPGESPARVGDKLIVFRPDGDITDGSNHKEKLAERTRTVGEVKVLSVNGSTLTVQVGRTWEEIERGDLVRPWIEQSKALVPRANRIALEGSIVGAVNQTLTTFGETNEVFINKGSADGVEEGNTFTVVRQGDGLGTTSTNFVGYTAGAEGARAAKTFHPDEAVGLLMAIEVKEHVSTAVVIKSIRELEIGERVAMRTATTSGSGGD